MLWNMQFFISMGIVSLYSLAIDRIRLKFIVPAVYCLFAVSFLVFYFGMPLLSSVVVVEKAFYVWVSAFSLFHVSVFWSLMSNTFSQRQSVRLFPIIAAGASAGALVGPAIPALFSEVLANRHFMLIAAVGLMCVVPLTGYIHRLSITNLPTNHRPFRDNKPLKQGWFSGFNALMRSRQLQGLSLIHI